ncbi:DgyrCDS11768 [Dimorphilus gyrociliatus]|uniref:DgyrCDS11768 n=1 Tax=Dimorphilus gyrociliatus TaxID=2664684 RepID=A0A7I8W5Q1_9ANNE|nr:DgyrCDS11768 [Dimorphilus gyrociliatus]
MLHAIFVFSFVIFLEKQRPNFEVILYPYLSSEMNILDTEIGEKQEKERIILAERPESLGIIVFDGVYKRTMRKDFVLKDTADVDNAYLVVNEGEFISIIGDENVSLNQMIYLACGLEIPTSGRVFINGFNTRLNREEICKVCGVALSNPQYLPQFLTVRELLVIYSRFRNIKNDKLNEHVCNIIDMFSLRDIEHFKIGELVDSNLQMVNLAAASVGHPPIIVLQECHLEFSISK